MFSRNRRLALAAIYFALYLLLEWLCYARPVLAPQITPWHPQAGLTLAFLMACGAEWAPLCALAAFGGALFIRNVQAPAYVLLAGSVWIALAYALAAMALRRLLAAQAIRSTADAAKFAALAALTAFAAAAGFVGVFMAVEQMSVTDALRGVARHGFADLNGMLMLTPLLLPADLRAVLQELRPRATEAAAQFALVSGILWLIFALPDNEQLRVLYLLFVPVIWIALRWGWAGALLAVLVIQAGLVFAAEADIHTPRFIDTQFLLLTLGLTALLLGSVVAERRRSELQLRQRDADLARAMRFAVAGELASATAHELNQPITALVSYLNAAEILAGMPAGDLDRLRSTVRKATQEAIRAADVLHRLRNFYTGGRARRDRVQVGALCEAVAADFSDGLRRAGISLKVFALPGLPDIETDATQLQIVLHNLIANAVEATMQAAEREKRIEVWATVDDSQASITVEDSGRGISAPIAGQLFEPFVTTKPDGMGLGLAISRSLVRAAGGELRNVAGSRLGGARLQIVLPRSPPGAESA